MWMQFKVSFANFASTSGPSPAEFLRFLVQLWPWMLTNLLVGVNTLLVQDLKFCFMNCVCSWNLIMTPKLKVYSEDLLHCYHRFTICNKFFQPQNHNFSSMTLNGMRKQLKRDHMQCFASTVSDVTLLLNQNILSVSLCM